MNELSLGIAIIIYSLIVLLLVLKILALDNKIKSLFPNKKFQNAFKDLLMNYIKFKGWWREDDSFR